MRRLRARGSVQPVNQSSSVAVTSQLADDMYGLSSDISQIVSEYNAEVFPLLSTLPQGRSETRWNFTDDSVNPRVNGLDGSNLLVDIDASSVVDGGKYWRSDLARPRTVKEALNEVHSTINNSLDALRTEMASLSITASTGLSSLIQSRIGAAIFGTGASSASSLDGRSSANQTHLLQIARDLYDESSGWSWTSDGSPLLSNYSLRDMVSALLTLHNGTWDSDITIDHSSVGGGGSAYWDRSGTILTPLNSGDTLRAGSGSAGTPGFSYENATTTGQFLNEDPVINRPAFSIEKYQVAEFNTSTPGSSPGELRIGRWDDHGDNGGTGETVGILSFVGTDSNGDGYTNEFAYSSIYSYVLDDAAGSEDAITFISSTAGGTAGSKLFYIGGFAGETFGAFDTGSAVWSYYTPQTSHGAAGSSGTAFGSNYYAIDSAGGPITPGSFQVYITDNTTGAYTSELRWFANTALLTLESDGTLSVTPPGGTNYEDLVLGEDDLPNKKYVDDLVSASGSPIEVYTDVAAAQAVAPGTDDLAWVISTQTLYGFLGGTGSGDDKHIITVGPDSWQGVAGKYVNYTFRSNKLLVGASVESFGLGEGALALVTATSGLRNIAIGYNALNVATTADDNIAIGTSALDAITTSGDRNIALGTDALGACISGDDNIAIGDDALSSMTSLSDVVAIGKDAGKIMSTQGSGNVLIGHKAGDALNTTKITAVGYFALSGAGAQECTAVGYQAGGGHTGAYGSFFGVSSGQYGSGHFNTGFGWNALYNISTGAGNTALGYSCGAQNTGSYNTLAGYEAGKINGGGGGDYNVFAGYRAGARLESSNNVAVGTSALYAASGATSPNNVAVGYQALNVIANSATGRNVAVGYQAGVAITTGDSSVLLGNEAGAQLTTESNKLFISNSNTLTPLIYGEFDNNLLKVHGQLGVGQTDVDPYFTTSYAQTGVTVTNSNRSQSMVVTLGGDISSDTWTPLAIDNDAPDADNSLVVPTGSSWAAEVTVVARAQSIADGGVGTGQSAAFFFRTLVADHDGTVTFTGDTTDPWTWDEAIGTDNDFDARLVVGSTTTGALEVECHGPSGEATVWHATVRITEINSDYDYVPV